MRDLRLADEPLELAATVTAISNMYGFLVAVYREPPSAELLEQIRRPAIITALASAGVELEADFRNLSESQLLVDLAVEYTRLFVGPGKHIPPHESVHIEGGSGSLWGQSTAEVKRFIESVGFEYRPDNTVIPDHLSVELEFMQAITGMEAQAWRESDLDTVRRAQHIEQEFIEKHLARWVPRFCEKVVEAAELPFYKEMAMLAGDFVEAEKERIAGWLSEECEASATPNAAC